ncbi:alpha/beta fold hydrolase [bacterium]|nr:alpha/beta fold hydrolase [bacterium]
MRSSLICVSLIAVALSSCGQKSKNDDTAGVEVPVVTKAVTEKNYLNGKKFCETYKDITSKEIGKYVKVPLSYSGESNETMEIYTYTSKPFDAKKPTVIFVDGGPGQNTHGMREYLPEEVNQINFDQRGLGCSAPETFAQYKNADLFSTENNVRDIDLIRKAYGLDKVTIHGLSYGTVPATVYGSTFKESARSIILEGVLGSTQFMHKDEYKVEKLNLAIADLNKEQRKAIEDGFEKKDKNIKNLLTLIYQSFYSNGGMRKVKEKYLKNFFNDDGSINAEYAKNIDEYLKDDNQYQYEQQPATVDEHIYAVIACRDLDRLKSQDTYVAYSAEKGFFIKNDPEGEADFTKYCADHGVPKSKMTPYDYTKHKLVMPTYYFQGSHDGATGAEGAINHWRQNAQDTGYFMLMQKGGHNPYLSMIRVKPDEKDQELLEIQKANFGLFVNAVEAKPITREDIARVNATKSDYKWVLYLAEDVNSDAWKKELEGIKEFRKDNLN